MIAVNEYFEARSQLFKNEAMRILMMKDAPSLLSLGQLIQDGSIFAWIPSYLTCLIDSSTGTSTPLDVRFNLPFLIKEGIASNIKDREIVQAITGINIDEKQVMFELEGQRRK